MSTPFGDDEWKECPMSRSWFDLVAASGGLAFTVLGLASNLVVPVAPDVDASAGNVRDYLVDHHDGFGLATVLMALATLAVALCFGYIHRRLVEDDRGTSLPACFEIAAGAVVTLALAGVLLQGILAQYASDGIDDSTLLALHRTWIIVAFAGPPIPVAIVLATVGTRTIRQGIFPRWLGWIAVVSAAGGAVTGLMNIGTSTRAPVVIDFGSFLLACLFLSGVSVTAFLSWRAEAATRPAAAISQP
jgi:hypothetical protein